MWFCYYKTNQKVVFNGFPTCQQFIIRGMCWENKIVNIVDECSPIESTCDEYTIFEIIG